MAAPSSKSKLVVDSIEFTDTHIEGAIRIELMRRPSLNILVPSGGTLFDLRAALALKLKLPVNELILVRSGMRLYENVLTLAERGIDDESILNLLHDDGYKLNLV